MPRPTPPTQSPNRLPFRRSLLSTFLATLLLGFFPLFIHAEPPLDPPFVNPPWPGRPPPSADQPLPYGLRYVHEALPSAANRGRAVGHVVLLPEGYDAPENASRRWPVLFFLHGYTGTEMADFRFGTNYARAAHEKRLPGLILVFPNGMNEGYADRADGSMAVETHIIRELLPFIDATYRTLPAQRAVAGFSMGGYGAVRFRLKYPELFTHALSIDPYLFSPGDNGGGYRNIFGSQDVKDANAALSLLDVALARDPALSKAINLLMLQAPQKPDSSSGTHAFIRALESRSIPVASYDAPLAHDAALFYDRFEAEIMAFHRPFFASPDPSRAQTTAPNPQPPVAATAPAARAAPVRSPEINADGTVTFRLHVPSATLVKMWGDWDGKGNDMTKDATGLWSVTLGPIPPSIYAYSFNIDGLTIADPSNGALKPMRSPTSSVLTVPGEPPVPINRVAGVPHGVVHLHDYDSKSLGVARRLRVYTPPGYDAAKGSRYPVLYLLHGSGDNESTWTEFGKANLILDNLIAAKKAVPMIVVMTDGHAKSSMAPETRLQNASAFTEDLLGDVMPLVESSYRIRADREHRAIVGLSMGGNQAILIGLNHRDRFAWVGGMSSAIRDAHQPLAGFWADPVSKKNPLRMLWLRIGRDDFLIDENRAFDALLTSKNVPHDYAETDGGHIWPVWRSYLTELAPLLFAPAK